MQSGAAPGCLLRGGGGAKWSNISLSTGPALKKALSRGGGNSFISDRKMWQNYNHNGVGVLSSSPYVTELTSKKKMSQNHGGGGGQPLPPPDAAPMQSCTYKQALK